MTQAVIVTETAATIEEIVRTIKQLNISIETQAASVAQSSSSVEHMVANIASMGQTLGKTDEAIKSLTAATGDGKATPVTSNTVTFKTLGGEIETLPTSSKTVEEKFNAIFTLAEQVKEMSNRLTEAMREQENGSKEVLIAIKSINTVTTEVQAGSEEMLKGGEGVAEEMQKLDGLTRLYSKACS